MSADPLTSDPSTAADPVGPAEASEHEEVDNEPIRPGQFRIPDSFMQGILGSYYERQSYEGNTANGPAQLGNGNIQNVFQAPKRNVAFRRPPTLDELLTCYQPTTRDDELRALLDNRSTVCLSGQPGTGRFSTACRLLLDRYGRGRVVEILPPPEQEVLHAVHDMDRVDPGYGYILRIHQEAPAPIMKRLDALVYAQTSSLLLIRDIDIEAPILGDSEVHHQAPDSYGVFRIHVRQLVQGDPQDYVRAVQGKAPLPHSPREVAALAKIAVRHPVDVVGEVLQGRSRDTLRTQAAEILELRGDDAAPGRRRLRQHRRAFRLAYAALCGAPIHHVFDATGLLLSALDTASGWEDLGRTALEHSVEDLLGDKLAASWKAGGGDNRQRSAQLEDGTVEAIIDVMWHEFDHTRPALITWLNVLAGSDDVARRAATRVTATLALLDFDQVCDTLISAWSSSPKQRIRKSAAQVVVILGSASHLDQRILRMVRGWVRGTSNLRRDTAGWAYASGLRQDVPDWALADLRRIAEDPMQRHTGMIAEAVGQMFTRELAELVVPTLAGWVRADGPVRLVTRHAARSLVRIADISADDSLHAPPALILGLADGTVNADDLAVLWYAALLGMSTRRGAWKSLLRWLQCADANAELRKPVARLLEEMAVPPALRRQLRRCLLRTDTPDWIVASIRERGRNE